MAGVDFHSFHAPDASEQGAVGRLINLVGAASSVALIVGIGVWGYQLTVRDVTAVPVIRALEGPARVQPTDPGGQLAQHQGLAVNRVQSEGEAEGPVPQVILAPEPIDLQADDLIVAQEADPIEEVAPIVSNDDPVAEALALAEQLAAGVEPLENTQALEEEVATSLAPVTVSQTVPGVKRSPRPATRPKASLVSYSPSAIEAALLEAIEVDPSTIEAGTRLVQVGTYDSRDDAETAWNKIATSFSDYIGGKSRVIEQASSGGRDFYRLRVAGFEDLDASRRFCSVLSAENASCIPAVAK